MSADLGRDIGGFDGLKLGTPLILLKRGANNYREKLLRAPRLNSLACMPRAGSDLCVKVCIALRVSFLLLLPLAFATQGCSDTKPASSQLPLAIKGINEFFSIGIGTEKARIQFALYPAEQQQGLMHRRDLGPNEGMIFIYKTPQVMSFWMRNTPTPLDIGFFNAEGVLQEVYPLHPFDETTVRSRKEAKYAIEMPRGWFSSHNVQPGSKLEVAAVSKAVKARGMQPTQLNLP